MNRHSATTRTITHRAHDRLRQRPRARTRRRARRRAQQLIHQRASLNHLPTEHDVDVLGKLINRTLMRVRRTQPSHDAHHRAVVATELHQVLHHSTSGYANGVMIPFVIVVAVVAAAAIVALTSGDVLHQRIARVVTTHDDDASRNASQDA